MAFSHHTLALSRVPNDEKNWRLDDLDVIGSVGMPRRFLKVSGATLVEASRG